MVKETKEMDYGLKEINETDYGSKMKYDHSVHPLPFLLGVGD